MRPVRSLAALAALGLLAVGGACRGSISEKPPIHPVLDMDFQLKLKAQSASSFEGWSDGRGMRTPVAGTVSRDAFDHAELENYAVDGNNDGKLEPGEYLETNPLPVSMEVMRRGQERFNIYCSVCHDRTGAGNGLALRRAELVSPAAFNFRLPNLGTEQRLLDSRDGYFFEVITKGFATMPAYGAQIPVQDRWAIVHYVRALQNRFQ